MKFGTVKKAIIAGIALIAQALVVAGADDVLDLEETTHVVSVIITTAAGVYAVYKARNHKGNDESA